MGQIRLGETVDGHVDTFTSERRSTCPSQTTARSRQQGGAPADAKIHLLTLTIELL
jgi:hypothetical protein